MNSGIEWNEKMVRILIIENERILARDLQETLISLGHEVVGLAANFPDAVALASMHMPDLALVDIHIDGDRDGIALATELREEHKMAIAFLTSHADHETVMKASVVRPNGYLIKPFDTSSVDVLINTAMANFSGSQIDGGKITNGTKALSSCNRDKTQLYIEKHLDRPITVDELAELCNLSCAEFSRQFSSSFGAPPHKYMTAERINEAKRLLRNTKWPIAQIALAVGFANQAHFTASFRKVAETTPSQYRRFAQS